MVETISIEQVKAMTKRMVELESQLAILRAQKKVAPDGQPSEGFVKALETKQSDNDYFVKVDPVFYRTGNLGALKTAKGKYLVYRYDAKTGTAKRNKAVHYADGKWSFFGRGQ